MNDLARELGVSSPRITSAFRSATEGEHPSKRHAFAALDLGTIDPRFARALSKALGPEYYVQIEVPGVPSADEQTVYPFCNGWAGKIRPEKRHADGSHTHVHLIPLSERP